MNILDLLCKLSRRLIKIRKVFLDCLEILLTRLNLLVKLFVRVIIRFASLLSNIFKSRFSILQKFHIENKFIAIIMLIVWAAIFLSYFIFKGIYIFEGIINVKELSFLYSGNVEQLLIDHLDIQEISFYGAHSEPITLSGIFSSSTKDETSNELSKINELSLYLDNSNSTILFSPSISKPLDEFTISELKIKPNVRVNNFSFDPLSSSLSFCLKASNTNSSSCQSSDKLSYKSSDIDDLLVGNLVLLFGEKPITITVSNISSPELTKLNIDGSQDEVSFEYTPIKKEVVITALSPFRLLANVSDPSKIVSSPDKKTHSFSGGNFHVADVKFSRKLIADDVRERIEISSILSGMIRMRDQSLEIQPEQFLVTDSPGIKQIHSLRLSKESNIELQVLFSGESNQVGVGFNSDYPVQTISRSLLSKHLSQEGLNALLSFIAAMTGVFIPRLFVKTNDSS